MDLIIIWLPKMVKTNIIIKEFFKKSILYEQPQKGIDLMQVF